MKTFPQDKIKDHSSNCWLNDSSAYSPPDSPELPQAGALLCTPHHRSASSVERRSDSSVIEISDSEIPDLEKELIAAAMEQSMTVKPSVHDSEISKLSTKILALQKQLDNNLLTIDIRRENILLDALREARKKKFNAKKRLKVTFVGECAIDHGGPRREFFRLFAIKASEYYLDGKFIRNNITALQNMEYFYLGQFVAMSITQDGGGFPFLHEALFIYFSSGKYTNISVSTEDVPGDMLKHAVDKIKKAEDAAELQTFLSIDEVAGLLFEADYRKPIQNVSINDKQEIVSVLLNYHLVIKVKCCLDQFVDGLEELKIHTELKKNPQLWKPLFVHCASALSAEKLREMMVVKFADKGTNLRMLQEQAYLYFVDFMDECSDGDANCRVEDVLIFFSGSCSIPPLGFPKKPTMSFIAGRLVTASTCDVELRIPIGHKDYSEFKEAMLLSIFGNDGFGGI